MVSQRGRVRVLFREGLSTDHHDRLSEALSVHILHRLQRANDGYALSHSSIVPPPRSPTLSESTVSGAQFRRPGNLVNKAVDGNRLSGFWFLSLSWALCSFAQVVEIRNADPFGENVMETGRHMRFELYDGRNT